MDYGKLREAVWPVVMLRILAAIAMMTLVVLGALTETLTTGFPTAVAIAMLLYFLVYVYGGHRAVSKQGFSPVGAAGIGLLIGCLAAAIISWKGDWSDAGWISYAVSVSVEGFVALFGGFLGGMLAGATEKE